ncbi:MAG TPA: phosphodiester glycosidase family protein [Anaerolineaceae bacterium]
MAQQKFPLKRWILWLFGCLVVIGVMGVVLVSLFPGVGAQGANILRSIFGNEFVARLETIVFQVQDGYEQIKYRLGFEKPAAPWEAGPVIPAAPLPTELPTPLPATTTPTPAETPAPVITPSPTVPPPPTPTCTPQPWSLEKLKPFGKIAGEGVWSPYLADTSGKTIAYRTFLQPDPERPYATVAIVAFDLSRARLNYVLGTEEPAGSGGKQRTGKIPDEKRKPGKLLATFNGGFQATHGNFGAMADGIVAIPPRNGLGTIAIYKNGEVRMGEWGKDFTTQADMTAWRQNCPLVIQSGEVNPLVYRNMVQDWGGTIDGHISTWRSAIALSKDGKTLYYLAGSKLNMPVLAKVLLTAGAYNAIQLDINESWVHFVAIRTKDNNLLPEPLLEQGMNVRQDRYLGVYNRDFFYITAETD